MAVVRILVDGYSLLHAWRELVPTEPRHSARAREALIRVLTQYADSVGTPITLFFDGTGAPKGLPKTDSPDSLEIVFSRDSKTADDLIERARRVPRGARRGRRLAGRVAPRPRGASSHRHSRTRASRCHE